MSVHNDRFARCAACGHGLGEHEDKCWSSWWVSPYTAGSEPPAGTPWGAYAAVCPCRRFVRPGNRKLLRKNGKGAWRRAAHGHPELKPAALRGLATLYHRGRPTWPRGWPWEGAQ